MEALLCVGIDFGDEYTQLAVCDEKSGEPISVGNHGKEEQYLIPSRLAVKRGSREWVYGEEACRLLETNDAVDAGDIRKKAATGQKTEIYGTTFEPAELLSRFFRKVLLLVKSLYVDRQIGYLVVSVPEKSDLDNQCLRDNIREAFSGLLRSDCDLQIQSHTASFLHYTIGQRRELWQNDTLLFEFRDSGLFCTRLSINHKENPMVAAVQERDFSSQLKLDLVRREPDNAAHIFGEIAEMAVYRKLISTIYAVGTGFESDWADGVLGSLCTGRKVFKGQNLYAKGACFSAMQTRDRKLSGSGEPVLFLGEERTSTEISMQLYVDGRVQDYSLLPPALFWQDAKGEWDFILDRENELILMTKDYLTHKKEQHFVTLSGLLQRERRMTRVRMKLWYMDLHTCMVQVKDMGFGEFAPANEAGADAGRVWETILKF